MHEAWQDLLQLKEQSFAGQIAVGPHLETDRFLRTESLKQLSILLAQQRGRRYGNRLVSGRQKTPAVATALGDEKRIARTKAIQYWQIVEITLRSIREAEPGAGSFYEIPVLDANQLPLLVIVWRLQPRHALLVLPRRQPTPAGHPWVDPALLKEKPSRRLVQPRPLEKPFIPRHIKLRRFPLLS